MRIMIAGATGVIGRRAIEVLTTAGHDVIGLARRPVELPDAELVVANALDAAALTRAVRAVAPDVVVHMLTAIPDPLDPRHLTREMAQTNRLRIEATANLIAASNGARIISQGVAYAYDPAGAAIKDEDVPLWRDPPSQFAPVVAALHDMERQVGRAGGTVLRFGHLYGPGSIYAADGSFTAQVHDRKVPIVGDGGSTFSFTHAHDAATAILAAVDNDDIRGTFNIVDDDPTPMRTWLPEMAAMIGARQPMRVPAWVARLMVGAWGVAFMSGLAGASNARARAELGWRPRYGSWREGFATELSASAPAPLRPARDAR